ncbi:hypothetical protein E4T47_05882 [Aureobasidium subglaciale]|nr:hypothetical protein E4T47_05882 [Aureobasidium subglaciale]
MADPDPVDINARTDTNRPSLRGNNPGFQNFDLSDTDFFFSDGDESNWSQEHPRLTDAVFLEHLSTAYNKRDDLVAQWSGQPIKFEGEHPKGYALFNKSDLSIHGHPSGNQFRSVKFDLLLQLQLA